MLNLDARELLELRYATDANDLLPVIGPPDGEGGAQCPEDAYDRNVMPRVLVPGFRVLVSGFRAQGSGLRVQG